MGWQALLDDQGQDTGYRVGDGPWDVMGKAFEDVIGLYWERYSRPPTREELEETVAFVFPRAEELFVIDPPSFVEAEAAEDAARLLLRLRVREGAALLAIAGLVVTILLLMR
jgi:hypothetical protein